MLTTLSTEPIGEELTPAQAVRLALLHGRFPNPSPDAEESGAVWLPFHARVHLLALRYGLTPLARTSLDNIHRALAELEPSSYYADRDGLQRLVDLAYDAEEPLRTGLATPATSVAGDQGGPVQRLPARTPIARKEEELGPLLANDVSLRSLVALYVAGREGVLGGGCCATTSLWCRHPDLMEDAGYWQRVRDS